METHTRVDEFSAGYYLLSNVDVRTHTGTGAIMPFDMELRLREYVTVPLMKIGTEYYWPRGEHGVPADTVAIPDTDSTDTDTEILLTKDNKARELVQTERVQRP